jgi:hypothetical protein
MRGAFLLVSMGESCIFDGDPSRFTCSPRRRRSEIRGPVAICYRLKRNFAGMIFLPITYGAGDGHVARIGGFVVSRQLFGRAAGY